MAGFKKHSPGGCRCCGSCVCTLNTVPGITNGCNHPPATLSLAGITSPSGGTITVTATSSNTALVPTPTVTYTSPNTTGTVNITWAGFTGSTVISVTVSSTACSSVTKTATVSVAGAGTARPPTFDANSTALPNITVPNGTIPSFTVTGITASPDVPLAGNSNGCSTGSGVLAVQAVDNTSLLFLTVTYTSPNTTATFSTQTGFSNQTRAYVVTVSQTNMGNTGCCTDLTSFTFFVTWS